MGSETTKVRDYVIKYCEGIGLDIGCGSDKIIDTAIGIDFPTEYNVDEHPPTQANFLGSWQDYLQQHQDERFDYIYSSHLLEDYTDTASVLRQWAAHIKLGGYLILFLPIETMFQDYCRRVGVPDNPAHEQTWGGSCDFLEGLPSDFTENFEVIERRDNIGEYSFYIVFQRRLNPERFVSYYESRLLQWAVLVAIQRWIKKVNNNVFRIVEIGVGSGITALELADDARRSGIPWQYQGIDNLSDDRTKAIAFDSTNMSLIVGNSLDVIDKVDVPIHMLFIDGSHDEQTVRADVVNYGPLVEEGFLMAIHDVSRDGVGAVYTDILRDEHWRELIYSYEPVSDTDIITPGISVFEREILSG